MYERNDKSARVGSETHSDEGWPKSQTYRCCMYRICITRSRWFFHALKVSCDRRIGMPLRKPSQHVVQLAASQHSSSVLPRIWAAPSWFKRFKICWRTMFVLQMPRACTNRLINKVLYQLGWSKRVETLQLMGISFDNHLISTLSYQSLRRNLSLTQQ